MEEFLAANWYWFLGLALISLATTLAYQIKVMSKMDLFLKEGFSFLRRGLPTVLLACCTLLSFAFTIVGLIARFV